MNTAVALALAAFVFRVYDRAIEKQQRGEELTEAERDVVKAAQKAQEERFDRNRESERG